MDLKSDARKILYLSNFNISIFYYKLKCISRENQNGGIKRCNTLVNTLKIQRMKKHVSREKLDIFYLPVCVRMCRFNKLGRSNALPHTSQGKRARSPRVGRALGEDRGIVIVTVSMRSPPVLLAAEDDADDSPEMDLCSSSVLDGGEMGRRTRDSRDMERSSGDSVGELNRVFN